MKPIYHIEADSLLNDTKQQGWGPHEMQKIQILALLSISQSLSVIADQLKKRN